MFCTSLAWTAPGCPRFVRRLSLDPAVTIAFFIEQRKGDFQAMKYFYGSIVWVYSKPPRHFWCEGKRAGTWGLRERDGFFKLSWFRGPKRKGPGVALALCPAVFSPHYALPYRAKQYQTQPNLDPPSHDVKSSD